jgi:phospholipase/carboxylesterase
MNRLALDTANFSAAPSELEQLSDVGALVHSLRNRCQTRERDRPIATFAPLGYEPNYAYPLVVWLHGTSSNERELRQIMPQVSMRNYVGVAPRGPWSDPQRRNRYDWRQTREVIEASEARIAECISLAQRRFNIHDKRIFLAGRGAGGTMALRVAWSQPNRFAGVVSINGAVPTRLSPLRRVNELRLVPCFMATSRDSRAYPASHVCRDLRLLHAAGCTVALREYPGRDGLTDNMLADLNRWLMELVCGAAIAHPAARD